MQFIKYAFAIVGGAAVGTGIGFLLNSAVVSFFASGLATFAIIQLFGNDNDDDSFYA